MNTENMLLVADAIEKAPSSKFDMDGWLRVNFNVAVTPAQLFEQRGPICGTRACIAGWTVCLLGTEAQIEQAYHGVKWEEIATELLDLTEREAKGLFFDFLASKDETVAHMRRMVTEKETVDKV